MSEWCGIDMFDGGCWGFRSRVGKYGFMEGDVASDEEFICEKVI